MSRFPHFSELQFEMVRSRGPGGQNVNKTNSAALLRWNIPSSNLPEPIKQRLLQKLSSQMTTEGDIVIRGEEYRDQPRNKAACIERLREMIEKALFVPKKRIQTKPGKSAVRKRLDSKKMTGEKKRQRKATDWD